MNPISQKTQQSSPNHKMLAKQDWTANLPNHNQLPDKDDNFGKNYQEPPQGDLLTDSITPILQKLHPDRHYCIGRDCGIYEVNKAQVEMYQLVNGRYRQMVPNDSDRYLIEPLKVELGIWQGEYQNQQFPWLRWWDSEGNLLLTSKKQIQQERERVKRLEKQLRTLGIDPEL